MKLALFAFVFIFARLGSAAPNEGQVQALLSIPCAASKESLFKDCTEGPDCLNCVDQATKVCLLGGYPYLDLDCFDCDDRNRFTKCKVDIYEDIVRNPPVPEQLQQTEYFKKYVAAMSPPANSAAPPAASP